VSDKLNRNIIEAIKGGSEKAFEAFLKTEFNNVVFFANQFLRDTMLAKDIAQETFIALWNSRETLNPDFNIRSYTFTIARNKALNLLREKFCSSADNLEKREIQAHIGTLSSNYVGERIDALDLERLIEKSYSALPEKIRETFVLSRKYGLTYDEIAIKRGITVKAVEYHIGLALKLFRRRLKDYLGIF